MTITDFFGFLVCITRGPEVAFGMDLVLILMMCNIKGSVNFLISVLILMIGQDSEFVNLVTFDVDLKTS